MTPHQQYTERLEQRRQRQAELTNKESFLGNSRVLVFLSALLLIYLAFGPNLLSPWWIVVPTILFSVLLVWHEKVTRALLRAGRAVAFYERGLARLEHRWMGSGQPGTRFQDEQHPYAADLDLFGTGSMFELLCTARTRTGEDTLADWLKAPSDPSTIRARQEAVKELQSRLDLREDLGLLGSNVPHGVDFNNLIVWGKEPPLLVGAGWRVILFILGMMGIAAFIGWWGLDWGPIPLIVAIIVEGIVYLTMRPRVVKVIGEVEKKNRDLALLVGVLSRLEEESFSSPRLVELKKVLEATGAPPSTRIAQLSNLLDLLNSRKNHLFAPFALLMLWGTQMAFAIEQWRLKSGNSIGDWLKAIGEFEALCSLATFAFENPENPFPTIVENAPFFDGVALGHPLIPADHCVRNDLKLNADLQLLVISGSNMSGKSTMLRSVGINTVLALAGSAVCAKSLSISPLMVGATLRIQDSLQAGKSKFYAELLRTRQVVDLSRSQPPLLFLLDEIFHGTNSHDRTQGAKAVVNGLVKAGAIGLVTTHDLSLTHIVEVLGSRAKNVHFADHFEDGEMVFDYKMQQGIVQNSNAIALMRAVGLEV